MTTARSDYRFFERLRVRWAEVDMQQIVFNAHYLMYFDTAVAGYWRALAIPYHETMAYLGGDFYARKATVEYHASARYDDLIDVGVHTQRIGNSSMLLACAVFRGEQLLVAGELVYVFADPATMTSKPIPQEFRDLLQAYEAGKSMVEVRLGRWSELGEAARKIRSQVFVDEQRIPAEMEWDGADDGCVHALACNRFGVPLATGRLLEHVPGVAKIGRMAVLAPMRGSKVGRAVLDALLQHARERGDREALLHAQLGAAPFYSRAGFVARGPVFDEAGIPHVEMVRPL
ncbi:MAG: YbgC/FadM family acyl-CoA thioesterase [Ideonella sp.]|nr:YbgC/FadM family acyl-CoA thioesterase [Ideonella sp.]MCC7457974.1 YbgC/FadM family acyl-CoA thioesterase [Nitrospira sp.]